MKVAALDLGSNSFLCLIAEVSQGRIVQVLQDSVEIVRLGQDVNRTKKFHTDALQRADSCLRQFSQIIHAHQPKYVLAMATAAARDVENAEDLFDLGRRHGIPIEIIPGDREAEITFLGSTSGLVASSKVRGVIDIGGGSTEIICGNSSSVLMGQSLNIGGVRLTEKFLPQQPAGDAEIEELRKYIRLQVLPLAEQLRSLNMTELIAVAGTPTELARIELGEFNPEKIDGMKFSLSQISQWVSLLEKLSPKQRIDKYNVAPGRADILYAGLVILEETLKALNISEVSVSTRGVRFGVALEIEKRHRSS